MSRPNNTDFEEVVVCSKCMGYGSYGSSNSFDGFLAQRLRT